MQEKLLATLYKRKLVKNAFMGWLNLHKYRSGQMRTSFDNKSLVMQELLTFHYNKKLAEVIFIFST